MGKVVVCATLFIAAAMLWSGPAAAEDDPVARRKAVEAFYMLEAKPWNQPYTLRAAKLLEEAQVSSPGDPWVMIGIAKVIMADGVPALYADALKYTKAAVQVAPREAMAHAYHGWVLYNTGKHEQARRAYQKAMQLDSKAPLTHLYLAKAFADTKDVKQLERWLASGKARKNTDHIDNRIFELERQLANFKKDAAAVEASFRSQIQKQADNPWVRSNYASFLLHNRRYDEAVSYFEQALRLMEYPAARQGLQRARAMAVNRAER